MRGMYGMLDAAFEAQRTINCTQNTLSHTFSHAHRLSGCHRHSFYILLGSSPG